MQRLWSLGRILGLAGPAGATQLCGWLKETVDPDDMRRFELWLKADAHIDFLYKIGGEGVITRTGKSHSRSRATSSLDPGKPEAVWHFGTTTDEPATIDITAELHQTSADTFSDAPTPLIAKFTFQQKVPEGEKTIPPDLAKPQCATVKG